MQNEQFSVSCFKPTAPTGSRRGSASLPAQNISALPATTVPSVDHESEDDVHKPVPEHCRRTPVTMALFWITMLTGLPCVVMGFEWHRTGMSLMQVLGGTLISSLILLAYFVPAALLGACSGRSFVALSKIVFGHKGAYLVSANLLFIFMGWYGVTSLLLADGVIGLCRWGLPLGATAFICAIAMSANNLFGFKGVANFARFFAAPVIIAWVLYAFCKAIIAPSTLTALHVAGQGSDWLALTTTSSFVLGIAVWGNEPDYWRFGKKSFFHSTWPLLVSVGLGQVLFPVTGWLIAHGAGVTNYADVAAYLNQYSFGGMSWLFLTVLIASYFALSDSNIYGMTAAITNHFNVRHKVTVLALATIGGCLAYWLASSGSAHALQSMCELNAIILPPAVVIMLVEWFMQRRIWRMPAFFDQTYESLPDVRWTAIIALVAGIGTGLLTCGLIPGCAVLHAGIPPLQAWVVTGLVYAGLNILSPGVTTRQFE